MTISGIEAIVSRVQEAEPSQPIAVFLCEQSIARRFNSMPANTVVGQKKLSMPSKTTGHIGTWDSYTPPDVIRNALVNATEIIRSGGTA